MNVWQPIDSAQGKIVIVCDDGCSSCLALVTDEGILHAEDGTVLSDCYLHGAIWVALPDDYPLNFMEQHDDY